MHSQNWESDFKFVVMADCQFGMFWDVNQGTNKCEPEVALTDEAIKMINALKPMFCIMCGDMTQVGPQGVGRFGPGNIGTIQDYEDQLNIFKSQMKKIDPTIPLICVCGNHDIQNNPNSYTLQKYRENFGKDYFDFWAGGCRFLVINSTLYLNHDDVLDEYVKQNEWIDTKIKELQNDRNTKHSFLFLHHPPMLKDIHEEDEFFGGTSAINYPKSIRIPFLEMFQSVGVRAIFAGHYHRNAYAIYKNMEVITTSAVGFQLGSDKSGFRIVKVNEDRIEHNYHTLEDPLDFTSYEMK